MSVVSEVASLSERSDQQLLADFVAHCDADAFEAIVIRYQSVVMGVCARVVGQSHDVDDAFQATFLVLAKDARRIKKPEALSSWLYGVACRVSLRLVREQQRRREEGFEDQAMNTNESVALLSDRYDARVLDEELNRLPERYRSPMVMHYFVGKSNSQIADQLGMSVGTIDGRLKRGRAQLRVRLARRGVTMGVLSGILTATSSAQASTPGLIEHTVTSAVEYASGGTPSGLLCSEQALQLAGKELFVMSLAKPMIIAAGVFLAAAVGASAFAMQKGTDNGTSAPTDPFGSTAEVIETKAAEQGKTGTVQQPSATPLAVAITPPKITPATPAQSTATQSTGTPAELYVANQSAAAKQINAELQKTIDVMDFDQNTLNDLIDFLEDVHGIQIEINQRALDAEGLTVDDIEISAQLSGISLKSALNITLDPHELTYIIKNEVMMITTETDAEQELENRVYLVGEFLDPTERETSMSQLMDAIQTSTAGIWMDVDGDGGTMSQLRGSRLVIRQTRKVHDEIVTLLEQLRDADSADPPSEGSTLKLQTGGGFWGGGAGGAAGGFGGGGGQGGGGKVIKKGSGPANTGGAGLF